MVLCDASYLCHTVGKAGRAPHLPVASTLTSNRSLFKHGWQRKAGRYGRNRCRPRRTATHVRATPHGAVRYRYLDAGWLHVCKLGVLHVAFSRKGTAQKILGLVPDAQQLSAPGLILAYECRWTIEPWVKALKPLVGLGHDQNHPYRAAVTHRHLVCLADARLTHLRMRRTGVPDQGTRKQAADWSTAAAQHQRRCLLWDDLVASLKDNHDDVSVLTELERLRMA